MTLNSIVHVLRETAASVWRNPWLTLASIITVMISLTILGFSAFFLMNASNFAKTFEDELEIAVFVQNGVSQEQVIDLKNQIQSTAGVASVTVVTKEQALVEFGKTLGAEEGDLLTDLGGTNPLPDKLTVKVVNPQQVKTLAEGFESLPGVEKVRYGQGFVDKLLQFTRWLRWVGFAVIAAFTVASVVLISINIKMNVFSHKTEIQIMKLVGATNGFIRWPFFIEGLFLGLIGGLLASILVGFFYQLLIEYIKSTLAFIPVLNNSFVFWQVLGGLIVSGMGIGAIGSAISLRKFLKV